MRRYCKRKNADCAYFLQSQGSLAFGVTTSVCQSREQTDARSVGAEVVQMEQEELSGDFKQRVAKWEAAGVFDRIAAVEEGMEEEKAKQPHLQVFSVVQKPNNRENTCVSTMTADAAPRPYAR